MLAGPRQRVAIRKQPLATWAFEKLKAYDDDQNGNQARQAEGPEHWDGERGPVCQLGDQDGDYARANSTTEQPAAATLVILPGSSELRRRSRSAPLQKTVLHHFPAPGESFTWGPPLKPRIVRVGERFAHYVAKLRGQPPFPNSRCLAYPSRLGLPGKQRLQANRDPYHD